MRPQHLQKRQEERYPFRVWGTIESARARDPVVTRDVSFTSLFLETPRCAPPRHLVRLVMTLPVSGRRIVLHGWVVRVVPADESSGEAGGMALSLFGLDRETRLVWWEFVSNVRDGIFDEAPSGVRPHSASPPLR
jgi:hypothetical protein